MAKGKPIVNLVGIEKGESITAFCKVRTFDPEKFIVMATRNGTIKKTSLDAFSNPRKAGVNAMNLPDDDELIEAVITDGEYEVVLGTRKGMAIRFPEEKVRSMGRTAYGVKGINLAKGDYFDVMIAWHNSSDPTISNVLLNNSQKKRHWFYKYNI